ncbi:radical SAM protein [Candidatus Parcubacteria bacterium]|nr:MAG: radical SAM protein [Candidatus Parcubacteria bacterium]
MKILFCIYQLDFADHISLAYLSAIARERGHETFLCVLKESTLQEKVANIRPDIVAYSTNINGFEEMLRQHHALKANHEFVSIMGGPHVTIFPETFKDAGVDAFCIGEGEYAFGDFLECLENEVSFSQVQNLITAEGRNPVRPLIENLDALPFPDRDLTIGNSFLKSVPKKTFYTSRGCPYNCTYCANNFYRDMYKGKGKYVRRFSPERIIKEIEYVRSRYRTDFIKFGDDLFAPRVDAWLLEFVEKYPERVGIPFNCFLRFDTLNEELLALLKKAGCYSVHLSVDSTLEKVREQVLGRKMRKVDIVRQLRMVHDAGINSWVNFMLSAPESTPQDDLDSIRLSKQGKVTYPNYSVTVPMQGTALFNYCVEKKLIEKTSHVSDMNGCLQPTTLSCFTKRQSEISYNVFLLGPLAARLPFPLDRLVVQLIKQAPPNKLFRMIRDSYLKYNLENRIFKLSNVS